MSGKGHGSVTINGKELQMELLGYFDVFPDKTRTELRTAKLTGDSGMRDVLVGGTFIFTEYFCTDTACHCQRVLVKVFRAASESARPEEVATISYSWNPDSDTIWSEVNSEVPNPHLDPLHRQAPYAEDLLDFWMAMIERDKAYALRLQRHYDEIRAEVGAPAETWGRPQSRRDAGGATAGSPRTRQMRKARKQLLARARRRR
ncbi:MAG: hypothetical protein HYV60_21985 [Planctomycetia bacterium]|nr:hypothetical protein [Planctomycetia bacterium]